MTQTLTTCTERLEYASPGDDFQEASRAVAAAFQHDLTAAQQSL